MKCKYCGSELTLEDKVCPFCGKINSKALPYTDTMDQYQGKLKEATDKVERTTNLVKNYMVFLVVAIILAVLNLAVVTLRVKADDIKDTLEQKRAEKNAPAYIEEIDSALAEGQYVLAENIYYNNMVGFTNAERGLSFTMDLVRNLNEIVDKSICLIHPTTYINAGTQTEQLDTLAKNIKCYYDNCNMQSNSFIADETTERDKEQREQINKGVEGCLQFYLELTNEEIDSLSSLSQAEIALLIGRSLGIYD